MASKIKIIITHINPHLDEIASVWLLNRFHPGFKKYRLKFVSAAANPDSYSRIKNAMIIGVGRGKFDEHRGLRKECAATLVYKFLKNKGYLPKDKILRRAIEKLVYYVYLDDTGQLQKAEFLEFHIGNVFEPLRKGKGNSFKIIKLGLELIDLIIENLKELVLVEKAWKSRKEFKSKFGKSVGITLSVSADNYTMQSYAYQKGFKVLIIVNLKNQFKRIVAPAWSRVNLQPVYNKLIKIEPKTGWFLHHSNKMVICGSSVAPEVKKSKLTFRELIGVVKSTK